MLKVRYMSFIHLAFSLTTCNPVFNIFFTRELQKLLSTRITVNSIDPGLCVSELRRNITGERAVALQAVVDSIAYTSEEGGRSLVYGLVAEQGNEEAVRGKYLSLMKSTETSPFTNSKDGMHVQTKLWVRSLSTCIERG